MGLADPGGRGRGPVGVILAAGLDPLRAELRVVVRERELGLCLAWAKVDRTLDHVVVVVDVVVAVVVDVDGPQGL